MSSPVYTGGEALSNTRGPPPAAACRTPLKARQSEHSHTAEGAVPAEN